MNLAMPAFEDQVVEACAAHESAHWTEYSYRAAIRVDAYFVKFGDLPDLVPEIKTQKYIFEYAISNPGPGVPRIPRVEHSFIRGDTAYLVMEFLELRPTSSTSEGVTGALVWLANVPAPRDHVLGPLGGGRLRHGIFKDARAPLRFSSVGALQRYFVKAYSLLSLMHLPTVPPLITIDTDRLMFSQPDMNDSNFAIDAGGRTVLLDFAEIGLFPATLVAHTLAPSKFASIRAALGLSNEPNACMPHMFAFLTIVANPSFGLDDDGNPKVKRLTTAADPVVDHVC